MSLRSTNHTLPLGSSTNGQPYQCVPYQGERKMELHGWFKSWSQSFLNY